MPRPANGYRNAAGLSIPGTGDINGRFMDRSRLLYWAFNRGKSGAPKLYDDSAINIGTAVHMMAELDLQDRPEEDISFYLNTTLRDPEHQEKARGAFAAFREWRASFHVRAHVQEQSLVSERHQFGGTLDTIAVIRNGLGLLDFKTTGNGEVYEDMPLQLAAYGLLWEETHPNEILTSGYHLILLPKDGSKPIHHEYTRASLEPYRQKFLLYRQAYDLEQITTSKQVLAGIAVAPSPKPAEKPKAKPKASPWTPPAGTASLGEMLRTYGHVRAA